ncbi:MAG: hypothetical protein KJZ69_09540 [Phycisphaerales bacterium]|nr:hypothetical protein [Phycisphaerales bacterium]
MVEQSEKPVKAENSEKGDPAPVVERLDRIDQIIQLKGSFERFPVAEQENLVARVGPPSVRWNYDEGAGLAVFVDQVFESSNPPGEPAAKAEGSTSEVADPATREDELIARVTATYLLVFRFKEGPRFGDADLAAFAKANGVFSATPYWREYLNNSLTRAGLSPFMLPVMKMKKRTIERKR